MTNTEVLDFLNQEIERVDEASPKKRVSKKLRAI
jgi:hypothetical protein